MLSRLPDRKLQAFPEILVSQSLKTKLFYLRDEKTKTYVNFVSRLFLPFFQFNPKGGLHYRYRNVVYYAQDFFRKFHFYFLYLMHDYRLKLRLRGNGYTYVLSGGDIFINVGYSHQYVLTPTLGITFRLKGRKKRFLELRGFRYSLVYQYAARIRSFRIPDCYNIKGIQFRYETFRRKQGKKKFI